MRIDEDRLRLTQLLHALVIDYWHDVDRNWGRNAPDYYTEDAAFVGSATTYEGREKIRAFYAWRENRGDRTVVHSVENFKAFFDGAQDKATCHWFLMLYAADGKPVLPTHPPIQIAYMTDHLIYTKDGWKVTYRKFDPLFQGGTPPTNPVLDNK
ncbi:MAG: nuclear transport factor 2 family protein [Proteobacteria bacterium]|nr:nuclear transport factor 2 family protein [Pseudomonadota bacterium]